MIIIHDYSLKIDVKIANRFGHDYIKCLDMEFKYDTVLSCINLFSPNWVLAIKMKIF